MEICIVETSSGRAINLRINPSKSIVQPTEQGIGRTRYDSQEHLFSTLPLRLLVSMWCFVCAGGALMLAARGSRRWREVKGVPVFLTNLEAGRLSIRFRQK